MQAWPRPALSFEVALAVGFALAAWRPSRFGAGLAAVTAAVALMTLASSFGDVASGRTGLAVEAAHLPLLVGLVGLGALAPWRPTPTPPPTLADVAHRVPA